MATTGNFRYKLTSGENKIEKPYGYARETYIVIDNDAKKRAGTSSQFSLENITSCYHCKSSNLTEDYDRAEIYCFDCGYVQRQALKDYSDNIGKYQMTSQEHKARTKLEEIKNHNNGVGAKP